MIFGIWRNRRQEQDEELLAAFVDRRLEGEPGVELPDRLRAEASELAETAALLRSVERVRAPRSFVLSAIPERVPESPRAAARTGWSLALFRAPAIAGAAAAFILGLLVVGNLAGILDQDGGSAFPGDLGGSADDTALTAAAGPPGLPGEPGSAAVTAAPAATATPAATAAPAATVASAATTAPDSIAQAPLAPEAAPGEAALAGPTDDPVAGGLDDPGDAAATGAPEPPEALEAPVAGAAGTAERSAAPPPQVSDESTQPELEATVDPGPAEAATQLFAVDSTAFDNGDDGIDLPLWQLEVVFGLLALVLGGAAVATKRR
ncbi:MAG: hypothetical protein O3C10_03940 [Chloroflexi bacterium]|nr:hypothetical protein [Chloroflexota bacterium]